MERIKDEQMLMKRLALDIYRCGKDQVVLFGGHFPLVYGKGKDIEAIDKWGEFSKYSLDLACKGGKYAKDWMDKEIEFVFFVDDHSYEDWNKIGGSQIKTPRRNLYKLRSGSNAKLPEEFRNLMLAHGFSEQDVLRHDHRKIGREDCLYFSEKILRASRRDIDNICAKEYTEFIEDPKYFDKEKSHLIAFIPQRCKGHICNVALDQEIEGLSSSHIFMETMTPGITREELYLVGRGITYRRN